MQKVNPCDVHFDPQSGHSCDRRSRCFKTRIQVGMEETVKQRIDGVATKAFVRQNLEDPARFAEFLHSFNTVATNLLKRLCEARSLVYGRDLVFAFKGGNVMRLVLRDVMDQLPQSVQNEWTDLMQVGDMDFEVFINDATEQMVRDTTVLMLYLLYSFRVMMQQRGWILKTDQQTLDDIVTVVPAATSLIADGHQARSEDSITVPYSLDDGCDLLFVPVKTVLQRRDRRGQLQWLQTDVRSDTPLTISMNRSLSLGVVHKKGVSPEADIVLLRMKHGMRVVVDSTCYKKATAEVIDVSIPTNKDRMHRIKSQDKSVGWFTEYEFELGGHKIKIHAPSLDNFVLDLHMFMFVLSEFPWYDPKQAKRMKRYVWFGTMLRSQQGASGRLIVTELASLARVLASVVGSKAVKADPAHGHARASSSASSLARRTSPWAELVQQIEATRIKADAAGIGTKDWKTFVTDMRDTVMAVKVSYATLIVASAQAQVAPVRSARGMPVSSLTRATLAMAAISASLGLSRAAVPPPND